MRADARTGGGPGTGADGRGAENARSVNRAFIPSMLLSRLCSARCLALLDHALGLGGHQVVQGIAGDVHEAVHDTAFECKPRLQDDDLASGLASVYEAEAASTAYRRVYRTDCVNGERVKRIVVLSVVLLSGCATQSNVLPVPLQCWTPCADPNCLTLLSWNVHGLPWPIAPDTGDRLDAIATVVRATTPDVVVLQEIWLRKYQRRIDRALREEYVSVFEDRGGLLPGPRGGLLVLVRRRGAWQAGPPDFVQYVNKAHGHLLEGDSIAGKGVLRVDLATADSSVCLLATHLQSQYPEKGAEHMYQPERIGQLKELRAVEESCRCDKILVVGDFNTCPEETAVYDTYMTALGDDVTANLRAECEHGCGSHYSADGTKYEWIDYIFSPTAGVDVSLIRIPNRSVDVPYSDHDGLLGRIVFAAEAYP